MPLLVLGGYGRAGGNGPITSFAGADSWHDDISDGAVRCKLRLKDGKTVTLGLFQTPEQGVGVPAPLAGFKEAYEQLP